LPWDGARFIVGRVGARRILIVLHDLPLGGTERIALRLAQRWASLGREVTLLCGYAEGPLRPMVGPDIELLACDPPIPRGPGSRSRLGRAVAEVLASRPFDLLFIPGNFHWRVLPNALRPLGDRRPAVVAQLSAPLLRRDRGPIRQALFDANMRRWLARADATVSLSDAMTAEADAILRRRITTRLPLPALDDDAAPPQPVPADSRLIVAAGRLVPEKGFDGLIRAFARLGDPQARLRILGEGPERARLAGLIAELGLDKHATLFGYVPEIRPHLDAARLFVLSSRFEGYGAVIVEALAAGREIVATDCSHSIGELVRPLGPAAVVPVGDPVALGAAIEAALARPPRPPATLAETVEGYRLGPVAEAYLDLFDRLARPVSERRGEIQGKA